MLLSEVSTLFDKYYDNTRKLLNGVREYEIVGRFCWRMEHKIVAHHAAVKLSILVTSYSDVGDCRV